MNHDIVSYYKDRASEYEKIYHNPAEQEDLRIATTVFQDLFAQKTVLEIACGTGYWTERIAKTATSVLATDINQSVIDIAMQRKTGNITFEIADMFELDRSETFDGVFGGFIWSHILLEDLDRFLNRVAGFLKPAGTLVFADCSAVAGTKHDLKNIVKTDDRGNTFQNRTLEDGSRHLVLKNFPTKDFLVQKLSTIADEINFIELEYYWIVSCKLKD